MNAPEKSGRRSGRFRPVLDRWRSSLGSIFRPGRLVFLAIAAVIGGIAGFAFGIDSAPPTPSSDATGYPPCPKAQKINFEISTRLFEKDGKIDAESFLDVKLSGVDPNSPNWRLLDLNPYRDTRESEGFAQCFLTAHAELENVNWDNASLTARFKLRPGFLYSLNPDKRLYSMFPPGGEDYDRSLWPIVTNITLFPTATVQNSEMPVVLCVPPDIPPLHKDPATLRRRVGAQVDMSVFGLICSKNATTSVKIRAESFYSPELLAGDNKAIVAENRVPRPFPESASTDSSAVEYNWVFHGPAPPVFVPVAIPLRLSAAGYLDDLSYARKIAFHQGQSGTLGVDIRFFSYALSALLALVAAAAVLRRATTRFRLVAIAFAVAVMGGLTIDWIAAPKDSNLNVCLVALLAWAILIAGLAPRAISWVAFSAVALLIGAVLLWRPPAMVLWCYVALLILAAVGAVLLWGHLMKLFDIRGDNSKDDYQFRNILHFAAIFAACFTIAFTAGLAKGDKRADAPASHDLLYWLTYSTDRWTFSILKLVPLVVAAFIAIDIFNAPRPSPPDTARLAAATALMLTLCAPWTEAGTVRFIFDMPLWLVQWLVIWFVFRFWLSSESVASEQHLRSLLASIGGFFGNTRRSLHALARRDSRGANPQQRPRQEEPATVGAGTHDASRSATPLDTEAAPSPPALEESQPDGDDDLLQQGSPLETARMAARAAGFMASVPVAIFLWSTLGSLLGKLAWPDGALTLAVAFVVEASRWVVSGFVFGLVYRNVPGRIGPVKGLAFAAVWVVSCIVPAAIGRGLGVDVAHQVIYRGAQFALFFVILAVVIDLKALRDNERSWSWQDLRDEYSLNTNSELLAALAPAAVLIVTLAQQILAGSPLDVAHSFLSGIGTVINPLGGGTLSPH